VLQLRVLQLLLVFVSWPFNKFSLRDNFI